MRPRRVEHDGLHAPFVLWRRRLIGTFCGLDGARFTAQHCFTAVWEGARGWHRCYAWAARPLVSLIVAAMASLSCDAPLSVANLQIRG